MAWNKFTTTKTFAVSLTPIHIVVGDLNGDGKPDIVAVGYAAGTPTRASVLLGNGDGIFQAEKTFAVSTTGGAYYGGHSALADVNGDGKLDLIVPTGAGLILLLGNGNGTFQAAQTLSSLSAFRSVAAGDVNADGKMDLVATRSATAFVLLGNGDGTFQTPQTFATLLTGTDVALGDFDEDGKLDIVTVRHSVSPTNVSVLLGNGNGTFQAQKTYATVAGAISLAVGDVNGDGHKDILVANTNSNLIALLVGNGNGTFQASQTFGVGRTPYDVCLADIDGDGFIDLLAPSYADSCVSVLLGNGNGTFNSNTTFSADGGKLAALAVADVNGDGLPDVIASDYAGEKICVLLNIKVNQVTSGVMAGFP